MNSKIYPGTVSHTRTWPTVHSFRYPVYYYAFDLAELPHLDQQSALFGYNRLRPVSLYDKDYFEPGHETSLLAKVRRFLAEHAPQAGDIARIELVTCARYFNYVFNPVSFFYCYDAADGLRLVLAHVNNTFGETHIYLLQNPLEEGAASFTRFQIDKDFHVSPFFDREGHYDFHLKPPGDRLDIRIALVKQNRTVFNARLEGEARPFSTRTLLRTVSQYPLSTVLTVPRILWEATKLYFKRRLPVYKKPIATSDFTVKKAPVSRVQKWAMKLVFALASHLKHGSLEVVLPDQSTKILGPPDARPRHRLYVHDYRFFSRILSAGDIGLGESYMAGEWEADNLTGLLSMLVHNMTQFSDRRFDLTSYLKGRYHRWLHRRRKNSESGTKKNIQAHYDLSNQMYRLFLDESMTYSAGYFSTPRESLAQAQCNKLRMIIDKARIEPHHHVLEIGSGWGSFAIEAVRQTGCRVTTVTVSEAQYQLAKTRIEEAGLADNIDIRLCDYRQLEGQFDRVVSIEMIEAVGHDFLPDYFRACDRLLKPEGLMVLQAITIPDQQYERYRQGFDWIRKHIFPGGHLPSLQVVSSVLTDHTGFVIDNVQNIGPHYALTLARWRERFRKNEAAVRSLGFDQEFCRKWLFYFGYCEAAFATNYLGVLQLVLTRPRNPTLALGEANPTLVTGAPLG